MAAARKLAANVLVVDPVTGATRHFPAGETVPAEWAKHISNDAVYEGKGGGDSVDPGEAGSPRGRQS